MVVVSAWLNTIERQIFQRPAGLAMSAKNDFHAFPGCCCPQFVTPRHKSVSGFVLPPWSGKVCATAIYKSHFTLRGFHRLAQFWLAGAAAIQVARQQPPTVSVPSLRATCNSAKQLACQLGSAVSVPMPATGHSSGWHGPCERQLVLRSGEGGR